MLQRSDGCRPLGRRRRAYIGWVPSRSVIRRTRITRAVLVYGRP
jgi:hypothetical protein